MVHNIDAELLETYRTLGKIRSSEKLLRDAYFEIVELSPELFAFKRSPENGIGHSLFAVINNTDSELEYIFDGTGKDYDVNSYDGVVILPPRGWVYRKV